MIIDHIIQLLRWCERKILFSNNGSAAVFKEGEIWWCKIGMNIGKEIFGKGENFIRPILIFKKFNEDMFLGIPLTSRKKEGTWYVAIVHDSKEGRAILNQMRSFDKRRLVKRIGAINAEVFENVSTGFKNFYFPNKIATPPLPAGRVGNPKDTSSLPQENN